MPALCLIRVLLIVTAIGSAASLKYYSDYESTFAKDNYAEDLIKEYGYFKIKRWNDHPALICHDYMSKIFVRLSDFEALFEEVHKETTWREDLWELFSDNKKDQLFIAYARMVRMTSLYTRFGDQHKKAGTFQVEPPNTAKVFRWVDRCYDETLKELSEPAEQGSTPLVRESFDYAKVGAFYASLLYNNNFVCLRTHDLSLFVFKMFYFRVFPQAELPNFFAGFYKGLEASVGGKSDRFLADQMEDFFGFNLLVLVGVKSEFARGMVDFFLADKAQRPLLLESFAAVYSAVLDVVRMAEEKTTEEVENFYREVLTLRTRALARVAKKSTVFLLTYFLGVGKGALTKSFKTVEKEIVNDLVKPELKAIQLAIKDTVDPDDQTGKKLKLNLSGLDAEVDFDNLKAFLKYFKAQVEMINKSAQCNLDRMRREKDYAAELEKLLRI